MEGSARKLLISPAGKRRWSRMLQNKQHLRIHRLKFEQMQDVKQELTPYVAELLSLVAKQTLTLIGSSF